MKAFGSAASRAMRVLSPRIEPPLRVELGIDRQHRDLVALAVSREPSASMAVDLPTPGTPVIPTRTARPVWGHHGVEQAPRRGPVVPAAATRPA